MNQHESLDDTKRLRSVRKMWHTLAGGLVAAGLLLPAVAGDSKDEKDVTRSDHEEEVETRRVQIDFSVIDPKGDSYASVPNLTLDHFDIRLDWKRLTDEQRSQLYLDAFCDEIPTTPGEGAEGTATVDALPPTRPIIAIIDFNYLDAKARDKVATAIEDLADNVKSNGEEYKIYAVTRQVRLLTSGFTNDPEELRAVAGQIRSTSWRVAAAGSLSSIAPGFVADTASLASRTETDVPMDTDAVNDFFSEASMSNINFADVTGIEFERQFQPSFGDFITDYNPRASIAAIEGIMRAHSYIRGRKLLVVYTSEAFTFVQKELVEKELQRVMDLAHQGFTIWTVDVKGLTRKSVGVSAMLSTLAKNTGGDVVRKTDHLQQAMDGASQQLSCYYLLTLPVEIVRGKDLRRKLSININTTKYPDLWKYRVAHTTQIYLPNRKTQSENRRIAALLSPEDFNTPNVDVRLDYPVTRSDDVLLPITVRVSLADLTWLPSPQGGYSAKLMVEAVAERDRGVSNDVFCKVGSGQIGDVEIRMKKIPKPTDTRGLSLQINCPYKKDGLLTARAVVTDLRSGDAGAGRDTVYVQRRPTKTWQALGASFMAVSGRDYFWAGSGKPAQRDSGRSAWRTVTDRFPATPTDRLAMRYVLCGPKRETAQQTISHLLMRKSEDGSVSMDRVFKSDALHILPGDDGPFCSPAMVVIPEYSIEPGRYAMAVLNDEIDPMELVRALQDEDADTPPGILAFGWFDVTP